MTTQTKKPLRRERHIRAHALRSGDEMQYEGRWWQVVRQLKEGEKIEWTDKGEEKHAQADPDFYEGRVVCLLIKRGSRHQIIYSGRNAVIRIFRTG